MIFEWDEAKNIANKKKHGISFAAASLVFEDALALSTLDIRFDDQEHWRTIGVIGECCIIVAHTHRETIYGEEVIRIISARETTPNERQRYQNDR